ncbi:MAG: hypothetical protein HOV96_37845 [Nonomuraea sp.]|nr:hypothetical protein [Nonomuraea sp.]NUP64487.1 hypothetical protein [Nonomuraea sp.]NUP83309.1 hypothetical protein [Nonomuraea sp.]NUS07317.1 hypothetical protein [Nonomuraea sp.]NUT43017.1 hypothetical protein [Thermoactinospora sp.]
MGLVTAVTWTIAALIGVYLLYCWLSAGGLRGQGAKVTPFPVALIFSHPMLAVSSLACWVAHVLTGNRPLAWIAFGGLTVAALLGFTMFTRWLGGGRHERRGREFPLLAVVLHGVAGVTTYALVFLTASAARIF